MGSNCFLQYDLTLREQVWGWRYLLFHAIFLPSLLAFLERLLPAPLNHAQFNSVFALINFCAVAVIFRRYLLQFLKPEGKTWLRSLLIAVLFYLVLRISTFLIGLLLIAIDPGLSNANDQSIIDMTKDNYWLVFVSTVILAPVTEECLYRGLVFRGLYQRSPIAAAVISTAIFCAIHVIGYIGAVPPLQLLLSFIQYIPAGICLAAAYRLSGSLLCPVLIHAAVNLTAMLSLR